LNTKSVKVGFPAKIVGKITKTGAGAMCRSRYSVLLLHAAPAPGFVFGYGFLRAGLLVFSGVTFSLFFNSVRIAFASAFIGFESGATSTKCWR
jgi:hypothetical protein